MSWWKSNPTPPKAELPEKDVWANDYYSLHQKMMEAEIVHKQLIMEAERKERETRIIDIARQKYQLILARDTEFVRVHLSNNHVNLTLGDIDLIIEDLKKAQVHLAKQAMKNLINPGG